ncbi:MAG: alpha/beta fold hydrolase [Candidatus Thorarchaeota archaeon]
MKVNYEERGAGNPGPVVLVHGAGGSSATWFMQLETLSEHLHIVALDLNGHGKTPDREAKDVTRSYLEDIQNIVGQFDRPVLGGHSMGGALTQLYALENPNDLSGIVLVGTGARLRVTPVIFDLLDSNFEGYVHALGQFMFHEDTAQDIIDAARAEVRKCNVRVTKRDFQICNSFDIMEQVSEITVPTLVIVGEDDLMTPSKYSDYLNGMIAGSQIEIIKEAGHSVMLEQPERFNEAVVDWFHNARLG